MTDEQELFEALANDPDIAEAASEHAEGTSCSEENCWGCLTVQAIHHLSHWDDEDPMEIAMIECDDLADTLRFIAQANRAAQFLTAAAFHASMFAFANEFDNEDDEDN